MDKHLRKKFAGKHIFVSVLMSLVAISAFLTACNFGFAGSDFYDSRRRQISSVEIPLYDSSGQADAPIVETDEDTVQKLFDEAKRNKDTLFPASDFDNWVFYMTHLNDKNVGTYKFSNEGSWKSIPSEYCEVYPNGNNLGAGVKTITNVKYYRYKSRTDRWKAFSHTDFDPFTSERDPDGSLKRREERFLFFRFTATAAFNIQLDNAMLCVDTYTKFCWFYSEPGWCEVIAENKVPKDWVDYEDPNLNTTEPSKKKIPEHTKAYSKFYYYDPIGYVEENGNVVLYNWVKSDIANSFFKPRQNYLENAERLP